eukprot:TRINITY_DN1964_c0_g1_i3.p1 TRINITY_DN1964_c0_g1~~TRINITY_DN1964_c0_g1_i3.p1  ORF type:complete len:207 (+),score=32.77 TRINITY_DN1964_c0_g1_i3:625-1245(+)
MEVSSFEGLIDNLSSQMKICSKERDTIESLYEEAQKNFNIRNAIRNGEALPPTPSQIDDEPDNPPPAWASYRPFGRDDDDGNDFLQYLKGFENQVLTSDGVQHLTDLMQRWKQITSEVTRHNERLYKDSAILKSHLESEQKNVESLLSTVSKLQDQLTEKADMTKFVVSFIDVDIPESKQFMHVYGKNTNHSTSEYKLNSTHSELL